MISYNLQSVVRINLSDFQCSENGYDAQKVHKANCKFKLIDMKGEENETTLMQLAIIMVMLGKQGDAPGKFLDHCCKFFTEEEISDIYSRT